MGALCVLIRIVRCGSFDPQNMAMNRNKSNRHFITGLTPLIQCWRLGSKINQEMSVYFNLNPNDLIFLLIKFMNDPMTMCKSEDNKYFPLYVNDQ